MSKVLVTGGSGYIGSWVVKYLLEQGHQVVVTVRDPSNIEKNQHLDKIAAESEGEIEYHKADLLSPGSFEKPMNGCTEVYHVASPFVINNIKDAQKELIDPALEGTKNVLDAVNRTASVQKVILTSSIVAIYGDSADMADLGLEEFTEAYWNTTSSVTHQPYCFSKVLAEQAATKIHEAQSRWSLAIINPGFVMGPMLGASSDSASIEFMRNLISGKLRAGVPYLKFALVDVRDVAKSHLLASEHRSEGRHILVNHSMSMLEIAEILKDKFGKKYNLPSIEIPKIFLYLFGWSQGLTWKYINRNIGHEIEFNNSRSIENLKLEYRPIKETLIEMVEQLDK